MKKSDKPISFTIRYADNKTEYFIKHSEKIHDNKYDYSKTLYITGDKKVIIICPIHGEFKQTASTHMSGNGCPRCGYDIIGRENAIPKGNSIREIRPDLIKYLKNKTDADNFTYCSNKKIEVICPTCGHEKQLAISSLSRRGFNCDVCSDGISIPEKFGINLLAQLGIEFEIQKRFKWAKEKRYDFFIPSKKMIIEVNGGQHYIKSWKEDTLLNQIKNDKIKYELATNSASIKAYIIIDCRYSRFKFLKKHYLDKLSPYFNMDDVDWNTIWANCQKSIVLQVSEVWNKRKEKETVTDISSQFKISTATVRQYLKIGNDLNFCNYSSKEERKKNSNNLKIKNGKTVYQYSLRGKFIKEWVSAKEIERKLNIANSRISKCCNNIYYDANGYKWSHYKYGVLIIDKIYQYSMEGVLIKKWLSISKASKSLGIGGEHISRCCNNGVKSACGYIWKYESEIN